MITRIFQTKKPFIGFIIGGDGSVDYCVDCCLQMIAGGVDIIEIGLPFSDPVADGPIIQKASLRALEQGSNSSLILEIARQIRLKSNIPLVLFSYINPLLQKGETYLKEANLAGFNAILVVDLPPFLEKGIDPYFHAVKSNNMVPIFLVSPSTTEDRLHKIAKVSEGFIYYACQKGTTGIKLSLPIDFSFHINRLRRVTHLPIVTGFGIGDQISAKSALDYTDGFVVGSAFVNLMEKNSNPIELKKLAQRIDPRIFRRFDND